MAANGSAVVHPPGTMIGAGGGGVDAVPVKLPPLGGSHPPLTQVPPPMATNGSDVAQPPSTTMPDVPTAATTSFDGKLSVPSYVYACTAK